MRAVLYLALPLALAPGLLATEDPGLDHGPWLEAGRSLVSRGSWRAALPELVLALAKAEAQYGETHPRVVPCLLALGDLERRLALYPDARLHLARAASIRQRHSLGDEPARLAGWLALARLHLDLAEWSRSEELLRAALWIRENQLGPAHPSCGEVRLLLGRLLGERGEAGAARVQLELELGFAGRASPPDPPRRAGAAAELALLLARREPARARTLAASALAALAARGRGRGRQHPDLVRPLWIALLVVPPARGPALLKRAQTLVRRELGERHPAMAALALAATRFAPDLLSEERLVARARAILAPYPLGTGHWLSLSALAYDARLLHRRRAGEVPGEDPGVAADWAARDIEARVCRGTRKAAGRRTCDHPPAKGDLP